MAKKHEVSFVSSSAAEYLTFVAASGESETGVGMRYEDAVIKHYLITAAARMKSADSSKGKA